MQLITQYRESSEWLQHAEKETETVKRPCEFISNEVSFAGEDGIGALQLGLIMKPDRQNSSEDEEGGFSSAVPDSATNDVLQQPKRTIRLRSIRSHASMNFDLVRKRTDPGSLNGSSGKSSRRLV